MLNKSQMLVAATGLEDLSPSCGIHDEVPEDLPICDREASLAVFWHRRCHLSLSCADCYGRFRELLSRWAANWDYEAYCAVCREPVDPIDGLQAVDL